MTGVQQEHWKSLRNGGMSKSQTGHNLDFPNAKRCWLITKSERKERAKTTFDGTVINISTEGHQHLGALLGSRKHLKDYEEEKV